MNSALNNFPFLVRPMAHVFSVAKPVDIGWIQRYQMKDTDTLFSQAILIQILIEWFGHSDPAKLSDF